MTYSLNFETNLEVERVPVLPQEKTFPYNLPHKIFSIPYFSVLKNCNAQMLQDISENLEGKEVVWTFTVTIHRASPTKTNYQKA
jgi:hypothetical protein